MPMLRLMAILVLGCLAFTACQKDGTSLDQVKDAAKEAAKSSEDLVGAAKNLSKDKIGDIAKIAAKFEDAPAEAEALLKEHGWTKEEFDNMVSAIHENEELNKLFEAAKKMAAQH